MVVSDTRRSRHRVKGATTVAAAVTDGAGQLRVASIDISPPGRGEVAVELRGSGVCRTDLDSLRWGRPLALGHEGAGVVRDVGPDVDLAIGQPVVLNWAMPCGRCFQCSAGRQSLCERRDDPDRLPTRPVLDAMPIGRSFNLGTMSQLTVVPNQAVVPYSTHIPFPSASVVGCAVMTGYGSVVNAARVRAGSVVAVLGLGGVGLNVIQAARLAGARRIIALGRSEQRLEAARRFGATDILHITGDLGIEQVRGLTDGRGADYAFECTGDPGLATAPLALVRNGGMAIQVSGNEVTLAVDLALFEWDKTYLTPLYGGCRPQFDIPVILDLYATGRLEIDALISVTYPLEAIADAFADMAAGRVIKAVIEFPVA